MKKKPYPAYKPSGIEWLGDVPRHWEVWKVAHGFELIGSGTTPPSDENGWYDGTIPWVTTSELRENTITATEKSVTCDAVATLSALKKFPKGSLAIAMYGATIGRLGILGIEATTNQACCVMSGGQVFAVSFVYYWMQAFKRSIILLASGGGQPNISQDKIKSIKIPCPEIEEQQAINAFLDRETGRIDLLVAKKERLIELLREERSALISRSVTKGLDPSVKLKSSGVDWLGDVPGHWEVRRIAMISNKLTNGYVGPTRDIFVDEGVRYLQSLHIKGNRIIFDEKYYVTDSWSKEHCKSILRTGDVLIVQTGDIGQTAVVPKEYEGCNCHALIIVSPKEGIMAGEYLSLYLNSSIGYHSLKRIQTGALHPHLNCTLVHDIFITVPPFAEQQTIAIYLDRETTKIDSLIAKVEAVIAKLKEYRMALIRAAVTGKIDVREVVHESNLGKSLRSLH